jgi:hypothetical protein
VHDEFQAGSCSAEASYLGGRLGVARVRACDSDGGVGAGGVKIWRCQCRYLSVLVGPVLLCSGGEVGLVSAAFQIWGMASPLVHHPCVRRWLLDPEAGGCLGGGFGGCQIPLFLGTYSLLVI